MLNIIYMELVLNFYKIYNRWPNYYDDKIILKSVTCFKEKINTIPKFYEPVFKKFHFYSTNLSKKEINKNVSLLIEFFEKYNRWPNENEIYKDINIGMFSYNIKYCYLPIRAKDKSYLNKLQFFYGVNNHKNILILLKYYYKYNVWPEKEVIFENIKIGEFASKIKKQKLSICIEDKTLLDSLGFFNEIITNDTNVLLIIEFKEKYNRLPNYNEIYKGVNISDLLYSIYIKELIISKKDTKILEKENIFKRATYYKYLALLKFYEKYNKLPKRNEVIDGFKIGSFLNSVKKGEVYLSKEEKYVLKLKGVFK